MKNKILLRDCIFCGAATFPNLLNIRSYRMKNCFLRRNYFKRQNLRIQFLNYRTEKLYKPNDNDRNFPCMVCEECASGWISHLDRSAEPIIAPFLLGKWSNLDKDQASVLSRWIKMSICLSELNDSPFAAIPQQHRSELRSGENPAGWNILIGICELDILRPLFYGQWSMTAAVWRSDTGSFDRAILRASVQAFGKLIIYSDMASDRQVEDVLRRQAVSYFFDLKNLPADRNFEEPRPRSTISMQPREDLLNFVPYGQR